MFVTCVYEKFQKTSSLVRTSTQTNISSGSHVAIDNLLDIDNGFWPPKLILITQTPETICDVNKCKETCCKPFSGLKNIKRVIDL